MNIFKYIYAMTVALAISGSMAQAQTKIDNNMKSVIVYFTYSGNTELAAKQVAEVTGAKMIRLLPEQPYSRKMSIGLTNSPGARRNTSTSRFGRLSNRSISTSQRSIRYLSVSPSGGTKSRQ